MKSVLVLNQDYTPLTICSVERAFVLLYLNKADLLSEAREKQLRTIDRAFPFPSVIRIHRYINIPFRGVVLTRHNVFKRDKNQCQYCGTRQDLTLDHLVPKSRGGKSTWTNLVTACKRCNAKKGNNTPEEVSMKLKRPPFRPSYIMFLRSVSGGMRSEWLPYLDPKNLSA